MKTIKEPQKEFHLKPNQSDDLEINISRSDWELIKENALDELKDLQIQTEIQKAILKKAIKELNDLGPLSKDVAERSLG